MNALGELGRPVLLAASRKDFIGAITGRGPRERLAGTLAAVGEGVDRGASILRVHDVQETRDYLAVRDALRGVVKVSDELRLDERLRREGS
jgi:dihydropteroate synthase